MSDRAAFVRANRPRGHYVPSAEASLLLEQGWALLDDCPPPFGVKGPIADEVLLLLPPPRREEAVL